MGGPGCRRVARCRRAARAGRPGVARHPQPGRAAGRLLGPGPPGRRLGAPSAGRRRGDSRPIHKPPPPRQPAKPAQEFELRVVGPDGKPIPGADRRAEGRPAPDAPNRSAKARSSGSNCTGSSWRRTPRGGSWSSFPGRPAVSACSSPSPATAPTVRGGRPRITTSRSRPASRPSSRRPGRSGESSSTPTGSRSEAWRSAPASSSRNAPATSDNSAAARGRRPTPRASWRFDSVPVSMGEVHVEIDHPSFMPIRRFLERREFGIEPGREPIEQDRPGSRPDGDRQGHRRSGKADRRGPGAHQVLQRHPQSNDGAGRRLQAGWLRAAARPARGVRQGPGDGHEGAQHRAGDGTGRLPR